MAESTTNWLTKTIAASILLFGAGTTCLVLFGEPSEPAPVVQADLPVLSPDDVEAMNLQMEQVVAKNTPHPEAAAASADTPVPVDAPAPTVATATTAVAVDAATAEAKALRDEVARLRAEAAAAKQAAEARARAEKAEADKAEKAERAARQAAEDAERLAREQAAAEKARQAAAQKPAPKLPPSLPPPPPKPSAPAPAAQAPAERQQMWEYLSPEATALTDNSSTEAWREADGGGYAVPTAPTRQLMQNWSQPQSIKQFSPTLELAQGNTVWIRTSPTKTEMVQLGQKHPKLGTLQSIHGREAKFDSGVVSAPN